jgi:sulfhydrogenase subunit beta (sulfur reductase)
VRIGPSATDQRLWNPADPGADDDEVQDVRSDDRWQMAPEGLRRLIDLLADEFEVVWGPVVDDGVIRLRPIRSSDELPRGIGDDQEAGTYRLTRTGSPLRFSYGPGPDSLKALIHPPSTPVWRIERRAGRLTAELAPDDTPRAAVVGVRACDLDAAAVLGRTQTSGGYGDGGFRARRDALFVVAIDCTHPAATCFCGPTGPDGAEGYDLALTEVALDPQAGVAYLVRAGTAAGRRIVERLRLRSATDEVVMLAERAMRRARRSLVRELDADAADAVRDLEHPHWDVVAERCLACGNCTAVCPTCFCTDLVDEIDLSGTSSTRTRVWDTCFSLEYSKLGPRPQRESTRSRYRQWLSHKLGTWHDQFGESGCVGCGRCITWCPVGIDLTAEVEALTAPAEATS